MKYDYRFIKEDVSFELPSIRVHTSASIDHMKIKERIKILERKMRQNPKMKEYKPQGEFKMERGTRSTSVKQQQITIKPIVLEPEPTSPTLRTLQFEIKPQENLYQFKVPVDLINKKFNLDNHKQGKQTKVIDHPKQPEHDFYNLVRGQRTLNQFRLNKVLTILQEPLKKYDKQNTHSVLRSSILSDRSVLTQRDIRSPCLTVNKYKKIRIRLVKELSLQITKTESDTKGNNEQQSILEATTCPRLLGRILQSSKELIITRDQRASQKKQMYIFGLLDLVYDYDNAQLTPLHWAAKRGLLEVAKMLIAYNADVDAVDMAKRSCLYVACEYNQIEIVQLLLYSQANPWSNDSLNYKDVIHDPITKQLFATSRKIHILLAITPPQQRFAIWSKEAPAMNSIKNVIVTQHKQIEQQDVTQLHPQMNWRLAQFYNLTSHRDKSRKIERDMKIFALVNK